MSHGQPWLSQCYGRRLDAWPHKTLFYFFRHFGAYLRSVCGLNVILDMFEEAQMTAAVSQWVQDAFAKAEFVIFICPHFDCDATSGKTAGRSLTGDFNYIFRYEELYFPVEFSHLAHLIIAYSSVSETMGRDPNVGRQGFMNGSRAALLKIGFSQNNVFKQCFMSSFLKSKATVTS